MTNGILVDTHFLIWVRSEPEKLKPVERQAILEAESVFVSVVSLWEIGILGSLRRLAGAAQFFDLPASFKLLPISKEHCQAYLRLPLHHRDPFDRMLIAQSMAEDVAFLSRDGWAASYRSAGATILP